ncbi:MAG: SDR family NAD(P)-dependent oxidoreductase [Myxococcota bacterium]|nr:SDR family NAD(P)-dependent oxidoreductase [Myxococcota bacterium]
MMRKLEGCVALISGASRGIGRATAVELAKAGCEVVLLGRDELALEKTAEACSEYCEKTLFYAVDLADPEALDATLKDLLESTGKLNIVVNNAGILGPNTPSDPFEQSALTIQINLLAMMRLTQSCLDTMLSSEGPKAVINIASVLGKVGLGGKSAYVASKHGVIGYTASLFEELRSSGVKVCAISPGFVNTEMVAGQGLNGQRMIQPSDVASAVRFVAEFSETGCPTEITIQPQMNPYHA